MTSRIKQTKDGSHTLYVEQLDETYHSNHGALQEAKHVFIANGLQYFADRDEISIFEMGFGTGLNAWLTFLLAANTQKITYQSIEKYPVAETEWSHLNYTQTEKEKELFNALHKAEVLQPPRLNLETPCLPLLP